MKLKEVLQLLHRVSVEIDDHPPLIVGGIPRDKLLGKAGAINDVDITTGWDTQHLAKEFSIQLRKIAPCTIKQGVDGHISITFQNSLKCDFSSNFLTPGIDGILRKMGIDKPSELRKELYSRDFFCNTTLMSLDFRKIKDLTGEAIKDIEAKIIRTCLSPDLTFKYNVKRIIRTVYLAAKLDFEVAPDAMEWIKQNPKYLAQTDPEFVSKNINKALGYDADKAVYLIDKMGMWDYIPITPELQPYHKKAIVRNYVGQ